MSRNPQVRLPGVSGWEAAPPGASAVQNESFQLGEGARDAGEGNEAANETGALKQAGKGGKGQRAAGEGEKGKLRPSGRIRRSKTGQGQQEDRKAGRSQRVELGRVRPQQPRR